ncbi:hypothetical protein [Streptomyces cinereoruber]|uniref:hypothetical protein n=1 Tax=Streptomyces cinereoruber TaxID=67260 RepID=UPI0036385B52
MTATPLGTPRVWTAVMSTAGHRCQCTGACGSKHSRSGLRCDATTERRALLAAPADLLLTPVAAAAVPVEELLAWCPACHTKATARQRAEARERARHDDDADSPALFDL